jgi:VWFA-related protein
MFRWFLALFLFMGGLTFVQSQEKPLNPASGDYSESVSYEPRKFDENKKEKKPKKNSVDKNKVSEFTPDNRSDLKIPVFVYDPKNKPVNDLKDTDFKVFFNETEQVISGFETARQPLDIVLVIDTSPSTAYEIKEIKNFAAKIAEALKPEDKIQIISFNSEVNILCESTNDEKIIKKAIKKIEMGEGTSIYDAVDLIFRKYLPADIGGKTVILLSDGVDTTSLKGNYAKSLLEAEKNLSAVFPLYLNTFQDIPRYSTIQPNRIRNLTFPSTINRSGSPRAGITKEEYELGLNYLQDIALLSGGRTFQIKELSDVKPNEISEILDLLKPQYYISLKLPEKSGQIERNKLKVRIKRPNLKIQVRGSYISQ